ncbi:MAG: hypothetical protein ACRDNY_06615 [Gaiellaceae bacterium]
MARSLAVAGVIALLGLVAASPAGARVAPEPTVDVQPVAGLAPDGRSIAVQVLASCPERWTLVEAVVSVSQAGASGQTSFPLTCVGFVQVFRVTVPSSGGVFELGDAQVTASVVVKRGKTARADDSQVVPLFPIVLVELGETAQLESGGGAVVIDVTVACGAETSGLESRLGVSQGQTRGVGTYVPVCDGSPHTFTVRVEASQGVYQAGIAQSLTFANVEFGGEIFYGIDDDGSLDVVS